MKDCKYDKLFTLVDIKDMEIDWSKYGENNDSGLFVGTLGKGWSEMSDDATSAVTKSFPSLNFLNSTVSIAKRVGEHFKDKEDLNFSSLDVPTEDLLALYPYMSSNKKSK